MAISLNAGKTERLFSNLTVERRILWAGGRSIILANIAFMQVTKIYKKTDGQLSKLLFSFIFLILGWLALIWSRIVIVLFSDYNASQEEYIITGLTLLVIGLGLLMWAFAASEEFVFSIVTNDGSYTSFVDRDPKELVTALGFITDKINTGDEASTNVFNFQGANISGANIAEKINLGK